METLAFTENTTVVLTRLPDGKLRATSKSWDGAKVILPDQVLEVRMVEGRIRLATQGSAQGQPPRRRGPGTAWRDQPSSWAA